MPEMGRPCTICTHPQLEEINTRLLDKPNFSALSVTFGVDRKSLKNHLQKHIPDELLKSQDALDAVQADNTFAEYQRAKARIEALSTRTYDLLARAEATENHNACVGYIREARAQEGELREQRKLLATLEGRLQDQQSVQVAVCMDIHHSPQWRQVGAMLAEVLGPYPDLRGEIAARLKAMVQAAEAGQ